MNLDAKEKAEDLLNKYYLPHPYQSLSKNFALIAVDEIIDSLDKSLIHADIEWWQAVKQEIEKLV